MVCLFFIYQKAVVCRDAAKHQTVGGGPQNKIFEMYNAEKHKIQVLHEKKKNGPFIKSKMHKIIEFNIKKKELPSRQSLL